MHLRAFFVTLAAGVVFIGGIANWSPAGIVATSRNELAIAQAQVGRRLLSDGTVVSATPLYNDAQFDQGLTPLITLNSSASGTVNDTATDQTLVATGSGSVNLSTTLSSSGGQFVSYTGSGNYGSSVTTGTLAGYEPPGTPPDTEAFVQATPVYNSGLSLVVSGAPINFSMSVSQSGSSGVVFNAGFLFLDANDDGGFDPGDGDIEVVPYFVVGGDSVETRMGTLAPSASPYRVSFFGNVFDDTTSDGVTLNSFANWTTSFAVPEPASASVAALLLAGAARRRRARR
ncbi:hypothetical protein BH09PLA1_BH09PLA1_33390 [soil metagenome]